MAVHIDFTAANTNSPTEIQWVDVGQPTDAYPAALSLPILNKMGKNEMESSWDKDEEIIHQLPSCEK